MLIVRFIGKLLDKVSNIKNPIFSFAIIVIIFALLALFVNSTYVIIFLLVLLVVFLYSVSAYSKLEFQKLKTQKKGKHKYRLNILKIW